MNQFSKCQVVIPSEDKRVENLITFDSFFYRERNSNAKADKLFRF